MSIWQATHQNSVKNIGLQRILFDKACLPHICFYQTSGLRRIFSQKIFFSIMLQCMESQNSYSIYQFIGGENDSNSNTEWSQRQNLFQTVMKEVSNHKPFVRSNLLRYKSHNTN